MANSRAINIMAWGFASGLILILNIKKCEILLKFEQDSRVTSICFTENENLTPRLLTGNSNGDLISWNLQTNNFQCKTKIFQRSLDYIQFIATDQLSEMILCGSHKGNAMKMMLYDDQEVGEYRMLKQRQGPLGNVNSVKFFNDKHLILMTDDPNGEILNCWIYNDAASTKLSDKFSKTQVGFLYMHVLIIL